MIKALTPFQTLIQQYVSAAVPVVKSNIQNGELIQLPAEHWTKHDSGAFQLQGKHKLSWAIAISHRETPLHALPEYKAVVDFMQGRTNWVEQSKCLVGTRYGAVRLELTQLPDKCLCEAMEGYDGGVIDARLHEAAATSATRIEDFLDAKQLVVNVIAPVLGINSPEAETIKLSSNLTIMPIGVEEVGKLYSAGALQSLFPTAPYIWPPTHMVKAEYRTPKVVVERRTEPPSSDQEAILVMQEFDELTSCLRLFKIGEVAVGTRVMLIPSDLIKHSVSSHPISWHFHNYDLTRLEAEELPKLWDQLHTHGVTDTKHLALAVRRFSYKGERTRAEDRLVDLIVAAEALFLGGDTDERGELSYRLALRAASFIEDSNQSPQSIFNLFRNAYKFRSGFVHGSAVKSIKQDDGPDLTPEKLIEVVEGLLRSGLRKAVVLAAEVESSPWKMDWEGSILEAIGDKSLKQRPKG
ncbi:MAG: hypothetical protein ACREN8_02380 [Candidatus Dormibacteraceae bacterium]